MTTNITFGSAKPELTSANWLEVLGTIPRQLHDAPPGSIALDLTQVRWLGHLPLLALCLGIQEAEHAAFDERRVLMPESAAVRAFLHRWSFYQFAAMRGFIADQPADHTYSESGGSSRVLAIHGFEKTEDAQELRDRFRRTGTDLRNLLTRGAFLTDRQIKGLADLIVFELCENAVEHAETNRRGYILGRVSREDDPSRSVYEKNAAPWESDFFSGVHGEGMTELVIGDAGIGIIKSLREQALAKGVPDDNAKILNWAFRPFSTRKREGRQHTRGLWAVRNKVRQLGGVLYVRTAVTTGGRTAGLAASWDFFNRPDDEEPRFFQDDIPFAGTQFQILLPHLTVMRPQTYVAAHRPRLSAAARDLTHETIQIPPTPPAIAVREALEAVPEGCVLFVEMSQMLESSWERGTVDDVTRQIFDAQVRRHARVWALNPSEAVCELLRGSAHVEDLWRDEGILLPVVNLTGPDKSARIRYVIQDENIRSPDRGDTARSRRTLAELISRVAAGGESISLEALPDDLNDEEEVWLSTVLTKNHSLVEYQAASGSVSAAIDLEALAKQAIDEVLQPALIDAIAKRLEAQRERQQVMYRLPSRSYCREYIDPRVFDDLSVPNGAALERWVEESVRRTGAQWAISYSAAAGRQLIRAQRTQRLQAINPLTHYAPGYIKKELSAIPDGATAVVLVPITGSGTTIAQSAQILAERNIRLTAVCIIDTMTDSDRDQLRDIVQRGDFYSLVSHPIQKFVTPVDGDRNLPVATIDPETLLPILPTPARTSLLTDGQFWQLVADNEAMGEQMTYKGIDYTTIFWSRRLFNAESVLKLVIADLSNCFKSAEGPILPDIVCIPQETDEVISPAMQRLLEASFPGRTFVHEKDGLDSDPDFQGFYVVIVVAAASSGGGIARLLSYFSTAKKIHVSVFINRIPDGIAGSFTPPGGKVSMTSFQRLFTASPELRQGSVQSIKLPALRDYRPSCLSNRLLLFIDSLEKELQESRRVAQNPAELDAVARPVAKPDLRFDPMANYTLLTDAGIEFLQKLIEQCQGSNDRPWLYAILEEVAARAEAAANNQEIASTTWKRLYLEQVHKIYLQAPTGIGRGPKRELVAREVILEALLLDRWRWHRRDRKQEARLPEDPAVREADEQAEWLARDVLTDLERIDDPGFRSLAIRAIAKIHPALLVERIDQVLIIACKNALTELNLSLELTKILDDDAIPVRLLRNLTHLLEKRERERGADREEAFDVAISDLLDDLGLRITPERRVQFLPWERVKQILSGEPPDHDRTVRALIRAMRGRFGANAHFLYYRETEPGSGLFGYADAWPRKRITDTREVARGSVLALQLLDEDDDVFFSANLGEDPREKVRRFLQELSDNDRRKMVAGGMALFRMPTEGKMGIFRVWQKVTAPPPMEIGRVQAMQVAIGDAVGLIARRPSALSSFGEWQFEQMVEQFLKPPERSPYAALAAFTDRVRLLLGGDIATLVVLDEERQIWYRRHISGPFAVKTRGEIPNDDPSKIVTVWVAERANAKGSQEPRLRIFDTQHQAKQEGFLRPPATPWAEAWLAFPLVDEGAPCRAVIHVWHHVPGWFKPQKTSDLVPALTSLGGSLMALNEAARRLQATQTDPGVRDEVDQVVRRLFNRLLAIDGAAGAAGLDQLSRHAVFAREELSRLTLMLEGAGEAAPQSLTQMITEIVDAAKKNYGEQRFKLFIPAQVPAVPLHVPILTRALNELLRKANADATTDDPIAVSVTYDGADPGEVRIEIGNAGERLDAAVKRALFHDPTGALVLARTAFERHGGKIEEVGDSNFAVFRMTLPFRTTS